MTSKERYDEDGMQSCTDISPSVIYSTCCLCSYMMINTQPPDKPPLPEDGGVVGQQYFEVIVAV